jgi:hypothetical protein
VESSRDNNPHIRLFVNVEHGAVTKNLPAHAQRVGLDRPHSGCNVPRDNLDGVERVVPWPEAAKDPKRAFGHRDAGRVGASSVEVDNFTPGLA